MYYFEKITILEIYSRIFEPFCWKYAQQPSLQLPISLQQVTHPIEERNKYLIDKNSVKLK